MMKEKRMEGLKMRQKADGGIQTGAGVTKMRRDRHKERERPTKIERWRLSISVERQ